MTEQETIWQLESDAKWAQASIAGLDDENRWLRQECFNMNKVLYLSNEARDAAHRQLSKVLIERNEANQRVEAAHSIDNVQKEVLIEERKQGTRLKNDLANMAHLNKIAEADVAVLKERIARQFAIIEKTKPATIEAWDNTMKNRTSVETTRAAVNHLRKAFSWSNSRQGWDHWANIIADLQEIIDDAQAGRRGRAS